MTTIIYIYIKKKLWWVAHKKYLLILKKISIIFFEKAIKIK
jgi:hypothetical protein